MNTPFFYFDRKILLVLFLLLWGESLLSQSKTIQEIKGKLVSRNTHDTSTVNLLNELAFEFRNSYPDSTIFYANQSLAISNELNYKIGQANAYKQLAIGSFYQSNGKLAKLYNRSALKLFKESNDKKGEAAVLNNLGMIFHNEGDFEKALFHYNQSLQIRKAIYDAKGMGDSYNNIGNIYLDKGNFKEAIEHYFEALQIREDNKDSVSIANSYGSIAGVYFLLGKYEDAEKNAKRALTIQQLIGERIGSIQSNIELGGIYHHRKQYDSAIQYFNSAYLLAKEAGDQADEIVCLIDFGEVYNDKGMPDSALYFFELAMPKCIKFEDKIGVAFCDIGIAKAKLLKGDLQGSLHHSRLGYYAAFKLHNKVQILEASSQLAKVLQKLNKFQEANFYLNQSIIYKDSLQIEENATRTHELEFNYLLEKKQNEITLLEKDNSIQIAKSRFQYSITIGLLVMIVFLAISVYFIQRSRANEIQAKELVTQQKHAIERQAKDLEELNIYKNKIFSILSHDIRNPISSLNQIVELINEDVLTINDLNHLKDRLHGQLKSINILLDNVLNWSKNQLEGELLPNKKETNLTLLVNQNITLFEEFAQQKQLVLNNMVPDDFMVWVDPNHLDLAVRNILFNAIKFSFQKGTIEIKIEKKEGEVFISISDNGKGMDEFELESLFSYNKQPGIYGTNGERGAGIGLILTKEFVSKNDGKILVQSKVNEGSTFTLVFPDLV